MRRLSGTDALFLSMETASWHQHIAGLTILDVSEAPDFSLEKAVGILEQRLPLAPKFHWKLKTTPLNLDRPVWVDDDEFEQICDTYEEIVGFRLEASTRAVLLDSAVVSRRDVLELVETHGGQIDDEGRRLVIRAGNYVLEADARSHWIERRFLMDVGLALGMTGAEVNEILEAARLEGGTDFRRDA